MLKKIGFGVVMICMLGVIAYLGPRIYRQHSESAVLARANSYWAAVQANDLFTAYQLEAPGLTGLLQPHDVGISREWNQRMVSFNLGAVAFYADHAEVDLTREVTLPDTQTGKTRNVGPVKDLWTFVDGDWYHGSPKEKASPIRKKWRQK